MANKPDVGDKLEFKLNIQVDPWFAGVSAFRRTIRGGGKSRVSASTTPTCSYHNPFTGIGEVGQYLARVSFFDYRTCRNTKHAVVPVASRPFFALPVLTSVRIGVLLISVIEQGGEMRFHDADNIAPVAPVSTIGTPKGNKLLSAEALAAVATASGTYV
jgi:hypothetical protein